MAENKEDAIIRAYAMLSSLRKNVGQVTEYNVKEMYVHEFHAVLDRVEAIGVEVSEFRIPDTVVKPRIMSSSSRGGVLERHYSEEKYVERTYLLTKIDAILGYFEIITSEKPRKVGFSPPNNR